MFFALWIAGALVQVQYSWYIHICMKCECIRVCAQTIVESSVNERRWSHRDTDDFHRTIEMSFPFREKIFYVRTENMVAGDRVGGAEYSIRMYNSLGTMVTVL